MKTTQAIKTTLFAATLALGASTVFAQSTNTTPQGSPNPTMKSLENSQGNQNPATPMTGQAGAKPATGTTSGSSTMGTTGTMNHSGTTHGTGSKTTRSGGDASPSSETRGVPDSESKSTPIPSAQPGKR